MAHLSTIRAALVLILSGIPAFGLLPSELFAQSAPSIGSRIAVIRIQRVIDESVAGKAARQDLELELKKSRTQLEVKKKEIARMQEKLQKQASLLSESARAAKMDVLRAKQKEVSRFASDQREAFERKKSELMQAIVTEIEGVIDDLAEEKKYQFVLDYDENLVLYASDRIDLSDQIIERLDKKRIGM